ncbi:hypothetical protein QCA50_012472 [Cerrena zonata]|uniref:Uncharacterized protein n=1 Tax=Cerrena zonata TaxID=2478898 RepID=A0AAW0FT74_9APHY
MDVIATNIRKHIKQPSAPLIIGPFPQPPPRVLFASDSGITGTEGLDRYLVFLCASLNVENNQRGSGTLIMMSPKSGSLGFVPTLLDVQRDSLGICNHARNMS